MAIDTATKRYSIINFGTGDDQFPVPVTGVSAADRAHFLALYSGIALDIPSLPANIGLLSVIYRRRRRV